MFNFHSDNLDPSTNLMSKDVLSYTPALDLDEVQTTQIESTSFTPQTQDVMDAKPFTYAPALTGGWHKERRRL